jgi:SAM-dependent MidA family methyltransferase
MAATEPGPDPREARSEPALVARIRAEIAAAAGQRITFARYMELALTAPGLGYYATSQDRSTREGDFLTAPELHPLFGRCVGRLLAELWARLGSPDRFIVREWGAGRGTLERSVLDGLRADRSGLAVAIEWQAIDLPGRGGGAHRGRFVGVALANEFLDALPVHRVTVRDGSLYERFVEWRDGWFVEAEGPPTTPELAARLRAHDVTLREGQLAEICLAAQAWVRTVAADLLAGALLVIDYGHPAQDLYGPRRMAGTLVTYRAHRVGDDPFDAVGRQDMTAHVDLTALDPAAREGGLTSMGATTLARLLAALGLGDLLSDLGRTPGVDPQAYLDARAAVARLLDPRHLGAFHVIAYGRDIPPGPPLTGLGSA